MCAAFGTGVLLNAPVSMAERNVARAKVEEMQLRAAWGRTLAARLVILLSVGWLVSGCALTLSYRHADWLIEWQADHYFDLTSGQHRDLRSRTAGLLLRHRTEALPEYAAFLGELKERLSKGLSPGDMEWAFAAYDRFRNDLVERVLHDGSAFLTTVSEPQIRHVEKVLFHEERKARESFDGSRDARASTRADKALALARKWIGPLQAGQVAQLRASVRALPDVEPIWLESRRQRRQAFVALLREGARGQHLADRLRGIVNPSVEQSGSARARLDREWRAGVTAVILELDRLLTPLQRGRALSSIQDVLDDIRTLTRDP